MCLALVLTSCTRQADKISEWKILREVNAQMKDNAENKSFCNVAVGNYECNDATQRETLRKMEAAGLLTYDVKRYAWWEKTTKTVRESYEEPQYLWGYYYGSETKYRNVTRTVYNFEDHYIVNVALTDKGRKLVVDELPEPKPEIDKDLEQPDVDPSTYAWNQTDLSEEWPYIENPFLKKEEPKETAKKQEENKYEESETPAKKTTAKKEPKIERIDSLQYIAYQAFEPVQEDCFVKSYEVTNVKARNIKVLKIAGASYATAEVISKVKNVTDFGRILEGAEDGLKDSDNVVFEYFLDKGWVLCDSPLDKIEELFED